MQETKSKLFSVAKYIIDKCGEMPAMKLQKLVYYSQAWNLAWDYKPIFKEDFQAWANGPVCPELYQFYVGKFELSKNDFNDIKSPELTKEEKENIDIVLKDYADKEPIYLSYLTHEEQPWRLARGNTPPGMECNNIISQDSIQQYYNGLISQ